MAAFVILHDAVGLSRMEGVAGSNAFMQIQVRQTGRGISDVDRILPEPFVQLVGYMLEVHNARALDDLPLLAIGTAAAPQTFSRT